MISFPSTEKPQRQSSQDPSSSSRPPRSPVISRLRSETTSTQDNRFQDSVSAGSMKGRKSSNRSSMRKYRRRESGGGQASSSSNPNPGRRSSRPFTSSAAAAEFWANFNYVDVVGGDDTSHRRLRKRKQSIAVPRFSLDRRSSESRTIGSDSAAFDGAGSGSETGNELPAVPVDPDHPYPEYAKYSFNCLDQKSPIRKFCIKMITNPYPSSKSSGHPDYDQVIDHRQPQTSYAHNNDT